MKRIFARDLLRAIALVSVLFIAGCGGDGGTAANTPAATPTPVSTPVVGAVSMNIQYSYDSNGRVVSATYTNGKVITYSYDAAGNMISSSIN